MIDNTRGKRVAILRRIELENKLHEWKETVETQLFFTTKTISDTSILFKNQYGYTKAHSLPQIPHSTQYNGGYGIRARSFLILNLSKNHDSQQISDQNTLMSWFLFHKLFYKRLNFVSRWFIFTRYGRTVRVSINLMKIQIIFKVV